MTDVDYYNIIGEKWNEKICYEKEKAKNCNYENSFIDIGSPYWISKIINNNLLYYQPNPMYYTSRPNEYSKGLRPIIKISPNVLVTKGTGTKEDPYQIRNTAIADYEYTIIYNGNGANGGDTENSTHRTNELKKLNKNGFTLSYRLNTSETTNFDDSYCDENGTCHESSINMNQIKEATFLGWSLSEDDREVAYTDEQEVVNLSTSSDEITINLYAVWDFDIFKLPEIQEREGYEILGWYTEKEGGEKIGNPHEEYTEVKGQTLYARWQKKD